jgi:capsid protein
VPYEVFSASWGRTNDRLARVVLQQYRRRIQRLFWGVVVPQVLNPIWRAWFPLAIVATSTPPPTSEDLLGRVAWTPPRWPYLHPVQDVQSMRSLVRAGATSLRSVVAEDGEDLEVILREIAADNALADELGLVLDTDGRARAGETS